MIAPRRPVSLSCRRTGVAILAGLVVSTTLLAGCNQAPEPGPARSASTHTSQAGTPGTSQRVSATLRMTINGEPWHADQAIDAMVHPPGFDRAVLINGSLGPKDANEQTFSMILLGVEGPGPRTLASSHPEAGVVQIANLTASRYLAGSILGYDMTVELLRYSTAPVLVEARFSGSLAATDSTTLVISDGYFLYTE